MNEKDYLVMFYGDGCPHCEKMNLLIEKLEREINVTVEKREVWHNEENREAMMKIDVMHCDGVPFFFNEKSKQSICGEAEYTDLLAWATAE